jgi:hypothetical protein
MSLTSHEHAKHTLVTSAVALAAGASASAALNVPLMRHGVKGVGTRPTVPVHVRIVFMPVVSANAASKLSRTAFRRRANRPMIASAVKPAHASRLNKDQTAMNGLLCVGSMPGVVVAYMAAG